MKKLSTVFLLLSMWICCYCSITSDPGTVYWEQLKSSLFPIDRSWNSALGTGTSKLSVPCKLFPEQQIRNREENLLFPISCSRNAVPGTKEVHQTYLLQFRGRVLEKVKLKPTQPPTLVGLRWDSLLLRRYMVNVCFVTPCKKKNAGVVSQNTNVPWYKQDKIQRQNTNKTKYKHEGMLKIQNTYTTKYK